ncbi:MAG: LytTR family DNA-binding domain-containing protein [Bacteroidota bacterium]
MTLQQTVTRYKYSLIGATLTLFSAAGFVEAQFTREHLSMPLNWGSMSLYFIIPLILWMFALPVVERVVQLVALEITARSLSTHIIISLIISFLLKMISLIIDFEIQSQLGTMHGTLSNFLSEAKYLIVPSSLENVIIYWSAIAVFQIGRSNSRVNDGFRYLEVKVNRDVVHVPSSEIILIEAFGNYLKIYTNEQTLCVRGTIKEIMGKLDNHEFVRIHRSAIVGVAGITCVRYTGRNTFEVDLVNNATVKTGANFKEALIPLLGRFHATPDHK